jgi:TldD protein
MAGTDPWVPGRLRGDGAAPQRQAHRLSTRVRDDWFPGIDLAAVADAALAAAADAGAAHADVRCTDSRWSRADVRDGVPTGSAEGTDRGVAVRVLVEGRWGFAAAPGTDPSAVAATARRAAAMARAAAALGSRPVELADEPAHRGSWQSDFSIDPFDVPAADRSALLAERSAALLGHRSIQHSEAFAEVHRERVAYADAAGTAVQQERIRVHSAATATRVGADGFVTMRTLAPPAARGWEYVQGPAQPVGGASGWDWDAELAALGDLLAEKAAAPAMEPGERTLVLDPTNLWLTIHESVGHATELDRALGYEANYAGTTFATPDQLDRLQYGSPLMHVTGDRLAEHGLATAAFDDEGVAARRWDIVAAGVLRGYQLDRAMAAQFGLPASNGCAYADSYAHVPIQRMPNVSLQPGPAPATLDDLIAGVEDGLLVLGDDSWSIDMQRYNFQFTGQRAYRIRHGRAVGQVKDFAYQSSTPQFWNSLTALGGAGTYELGGAVNCGKGQPGQVAPVSHGCPAARFDRVRILNTASEGGRA